MGFPATPHRSHRGSSAGSGPCSAASREKGGGKSEISINKITQSPLLFRQSRTRERKSHLGEKRKGNFSREDDPSAGCPAFPARVLNFPSAKPRGERGLQPGPPARPALPSSRPGRSPQAGDGGGNRRALLLLLPGEARQRPGERSGAPPETGSGGAEVGEGKAGGGGGKARGWGFPAGRRSATGGSGAGRVLTYAVFFLPFGGNPAGHGAGGRGGGGRAAGPGGDARESPVSLRRHFPTAGREKFLPTAESCGAGGASGLAPRPARPPRRGGGGRWRGRPVAGGGRAARLSGPGCPSVPSPPGCWGERRGEGPESPSRFPPSSCRWQPALLTGKAGRVPAGFYTKGSGTGWCRPGSLPNCVIEFQVRLALLCRKVSSPTQNHLCVEPARASLAATVPGSSGWRVPVCPWGNPQFLGWFFGSCSDLSSHLALEDPSLLPSRRLQR